MPRYLTVHATEIGGNPCREVVIGDMEIPDLGRWDPEGIMKELNRYYPPAKWKYEARVQSTVAGPSSMEI
jgi:hypothetical protein